MPTAEHLFQKLSGDKFCSKIDLSKGYWQIAIPEEDIPKTAFVTPDGSHEFLKMPFGMINSAATLKRAMKKLIEDLDYIDFYWDDILVHTRTWEKHIRALRELFSRLLQAGLTIRPTKCLFGVNSVDFMKFDSSRANIPRFTVGRCPQFIRNKRCRFFSLYFKLHRGERWSRWFGATNFKMAANS